MKLTLEGIKDCELWNKAGITLPGYDVEKVSQKAKEEPKWVHFGIGNIFRIFPQTFCHQSSLCKTKESSLLHTRKHLPTLQRAR